ncbi:hypothetical protein [Oceanobacillus kimchii]|uniref:Uncharacterized protein n=1 Tax=Oceanobacillus kimchii TaxID=746691 RepID=A0ABQ5TPL7_9BACI|nr:hypothetical protein [Oceanobacillus kimchii]GLO68480.1 hypothetical protein MACH08_42640 [Oceanobacillus kimchii]
MIKANLLGSYVNKAYKMMKRNYIEQGYFASGSIGMNDIFEKIHKDNEKAEIIVDQLLDSERVQIRRDCLGLAFELTAKERYQLIKEHNLSEEWEDKAPIVNEAHGEIFAVIKEVKRKDIKLQPKHYAASTVQIKKSVINEQLSFELEVI